MKMYTILITGGAGFIGSHLTDHFLGLGYKVIVLDNLSNGKRANIQSGLSNRDCTFVEGSILDIANLDLPPFDIVYHLACLGVRHSLHDPFSNHETNATGTLKVLEFCNTKEVKHFFYISTSEVYGSTTQFPITEKSPTYPTTVYGGSKLAGEHYTHAFRHRHGLDATVVRLFNNFGPRAHHEGDAGELIPRTIIKVLNGDAPIIFGDGAVTRDFLYVGDTVQILVEMLGKVLENKKIWNGLTINIGYGEEWSILKVVSDIIEIIDPSIKIEMAPPRPADVPRLWVDNTLMKTHLETKPQHDLRKGLVETVKYFRNLMAEQDLSKDIPTFNF